MGALSGLSGLSSMSGMLPSEITPTASVWDNTITIDWTGQGTAVNRKNYAINTYRGLDPATTDRWEYLNVLNEVDPEFIRIHCLDMMKDSTQFAMGWIVNPGSPNYAWDSAKIQAALSPLALRNVQLTICRFPAAICDSSNRILLSKIPEFAAFCVTLIGIVQQTGVNLQSIGLLNEMDSIYGDNNDWHAAWLAARNAIKAAYPNLPIGGAAFANPWSQARLDAYIQACGAQMDFICANSYVTGSVASGNIQHHWHKAASGIGQLLRYIRWRLTSAGRGSLPIQLSEAGLSYSTGDPGNASYIRGIWEGLRLIHSATEPGQGILAWNESDDTHGLVSSPSSGFVPRMAFHVYRSFNRWMDGMAYPITVTGETVTIPNTEQSVVPSVSALAVVNGDFGHAIAIVNRSGESRTVKVNHTGWASQSWFWCQRWIINPETPAQPETIDTNSFTAGEFTIAPNSIHLYQAIDPGS